MSSDSGIRSDASAVDYRSVLDAFGDAVVAADDSNRIVYVNRSVETLLGWSAADLLGRPLTVLIPARYRDAHLTGFSRYLRTREARLIGHPVRVPALRADGGELEIELAIGVVETSGEPALFVGSLRDLRDRIELEREHEITRRLLGVLVDATTLGGSAGRVLEALADTLGWDVAALWVPDARGEHVRCMELWHLPSVPVPAFESVSRSTALRPGQGLPGRVWATRRPAWLSDVADDRNFPRALAARRDGLHGGFAFPIMGGDRVTGIIELFSRPSRERDPELLRTMTTIGGQLGLFVESRLAEEALRASRERLDLALDAARMGTWEWDAATGRVQWAEVAETIFGLPAGGFGGTYAQWARLVHPADRRRVGCAVRQALRARRDAHIEHRIVRPDGRIAWVEGRGRVLTDALGRVTGMVGVVGDITGRKLAEAERERLQRDRLRVADVLQRSLLPPHLPEIPGVELAARYRPAGRGEVGGDFYDLFPLRGASWGVVMGDVCGKGPEAATVTAMARHTLRGAAMNARRPSRVLGELNAAMLIDVDEDEEARFCTIVFSRLVPLPDGLQLITANGGHPYPLVVRADGTVEPISLGGPIVGAFPDAEYVVQSTRLSAGDAVVFYTDGVTEARVGDDLFGEERLATLLAGCARFDADRVATAIVDEVLRLQPNPRDDIALLVLRIPPAPGAQPAS